MVRRDSRRSGSRERGTGSSRSASARYQYKSSNSFSDKSVVQKCRLAGLVLRGKPFISPRAFATSSVCYIPILLMYDTASSAVLPFCGANLNLECLRLLSMALQSVYSPDNPI